MKFDETVCITTNKESELKWIRRSRKKGLRSVKIHRASENNLDAHLTVLKNSYKKELSNVLVFTDFTRIISGGFGIPEPPKDYEIIFLGGDPQYVKKHINEHYVEAVIKGAFAYIVRNTAYKKITELSKNFEGNLTDFFLMLSDTLKSYTLRHSIVVDELNPFIKGMNESPESLSEAPESKDLDDYPVVNLVTITKDNQVMFPLTIRSFYKQNYPREKLNWIIIDNSTVEDRSVKELVELCNDPRIKYIDNIKRLFPEDSVQNEIKHFLKYIENQRTFILHFDENCYYPPNSTKSRMNTLSVLPEGTMLGMTIVPFYDLIAEKGYSISQTDINNHKIIPHSGSLSYDLQFWNEHKYTKNVLEWITSRFDKVYTTTEPLIYAITATTELPEKYANEGLIFTWDYETIQFMKVLKETL